MGADNHPTTKVETDDNQDAVPSVNGHALDGLAGVEAAFGYLKKDYNDGHITRTIDGESIVIRSRYRGFQHMDALLDAHASDATPVTLVDATAEKFNGEVRTRVELTT